MRIISPWRDYYDNCQGFGIDKLVTYHRENAKFTSIFYNDKGNPFEKSIAEVNVGVNASSGWGPNLGNEVHGLTKKPSSWGRVSVIGVCGVLHKVYIHSIFVHSSMEHGKYVPAGWQNTIYFSADQMPEEIRRTRAYLDWGSRFVLEEWFAEPLNRRNDDVFVFYDAPLLLINAKTVQVNPNMKDLGFAPHKDGTSLFQEISSYIAGTLNTAKQMKGTERNDELTALSKGFDKNSFRKGPTKRGK